MDNSLIVDLNFVSSTAAGLGDQVNMFASIPSDRGPIGVVYDPSAKPEPVRLARLILRHHPSADFREDLWYHLDHCLADQENDISETVANAFKDPSIPTRMFFSDMELALMAQTLEEVGWDPAEQYLVICPNLPHERDDKALHVNEWVEIVRAYQGVVPQVIITPTFRQEYDDVDYRIEQRLLGEGFEVLNLHASLVRDEFTLSSFQGIISEFGGGEARDHLSFRQDAAIYHLLLQRDWQGIFHDSAPVHIAAAASGRKVLSVRALNQMYDPHNGGASLSYIGDDFDIAMKSLQQYIPHLESKG